VGHGRLPVALNPPRKFYVGDAVRRQEYKLMVISPRRRRSSQYCEFVVEGKPMEFVSSYIHLGHLLTDRLDDSTDISPGRGEFVVQVNNVPCYFQKQCSAVKCTLFQLLWLRAMEFVIL